MGFLEIQGAHIVLAVGQLDHQHAHVMAHGQDHLADILGLGFLLVFKRDHADLGDPVHNVGHFLAEILVYLLNGGLGVLHGVMQQARSHRRLVKAHFRQGVGHGQGMGEVGLAGKACLPGVGRGGEHIGLLDQLQICVLVVGRHFVENFLNADHGSALPSCEK